MSDVQSTTAGARSPVSPAMVRRAVIGGSIGSLVEWFDFAVYGYMAATLGQLFFPTKDPSASLLLSLATFGAAFVVRPLGGIFFGTLGDKIGRQRTLVSVLTLVSVSTFAVGLLPTFAVVGAVAPALLVALRLLQGFSAGGEMGGASAFVAEYSPPNRRGYLVSWVEAGCIMGFLFGSIAALILNLSLTDDQMNTWGWRLPFLLGGPLGLIGLFIRYRLEETPEFKALADAGEVSTSPLVETIRHHWRPILQTAGFALVQNATLYVLLTYMPTYFTSILKYTKIEASVAAVITLAVTTVLIPPFGALSDRYGRKVILSSACVGLAMGSFPLFLLMNAGYYPIAVASYVFLGALLAVFLGPTLAAMNELFVTKVRYGGFSIGYNLSVSAFGGTAPFLVALLIQVTGNPLSPSFYVIASALVTLAVIPTVMEGAVRARVT